VVSLADGRHRAPHPRAAPPHQRRVECRNQPRTHAPETDVYPGRARKLLYKPHIPLLEERNTRKGFFEQHQLASVLSHLPAPLRPVIMFAFITGWRIRSEVLSLEWRQVDFAADSKGTSRSTSLPGDRLHNEASSPQANPVMISASRSG
jgi:integrase